MKKITLEIRRTVYEDSYAVKPYIRLPNGELYNVWTILGTEWHPSTEDAIKSAFELGMKATKQIVQESLKEIT